MELPLIAVIGSLNHDESIFVRDFRAQGIGGTTRVKERKEGVGGKGANQAIAALRTSSRRKDVDKKVNVKMIGAVGKDKWGEEVTNTLKRDGVDTSGVKESDGLFTGKAIIHVNDRGDSHVSHESNANDNLFAEDFRTLESLGGGPSEKPALVVVQLEIPIAVVEAVLATAAEHGVSVLLNPAPPAIIINDYWKAVTHVVANLGDAQEMSGKSEKDLGPYKTGWQQIADELHWKGVKYVVITLGEVGVFYSEGIGEGTHLEANKVTVVDSTTAGDAFIGAYAAKIVQMGDSIDMRLAVEYGMLAAAHVVENAGTLVTIPWGISLMDRRQSLTDTPQVSSSA
jgi:ribokinase